MSDTEVRRLYVGNLLYQVQPEEVVEFFSINGFNLYDMPAQVQPLQY